MFLLILPFFFFLVTSAAEPECFDLGPLGKLCLRVTNQQCFNLDVGITLGNITLFKRVLPIGSLLQLAQAYKRLGQKLILCQKAPAPFSCSACVEATQIEVKPATGVLLLCIKPSTNCSTVNLGDFTKERCLNITGCQLFGCQNNCSGHGTCGTFGCNCSKGYYGVDCAISSKDNCLVNSNRPNDKICWTPRAPQSCADKVEFDATAPWVKKPLSTSIVIKTLQPEASVPVLPCLPGAIPDSSYFKNCTYCVDLKKLSFANHQLSGCPVVKLNCLNYDVAADTLECGKIAESSHYELSCAASPVPRTPATPFPAPVATPDSTNENNFGSGIYVAIIVVAVVAVVFATGAYFAWMHYKDRQSAGQIEEQELSMSLSSEEDNDPASNPRQSIINQDDSISLSDETD